MTFSSPTRVSTRYPGTFGLFCGFQGLWTRYRLRDPVPGWKPKKARLSAEGTGVPDQNPRTAKKGRMVRSKRRGGL